MLSPQLSMVAASNNVTMDMAMLSNLQALESYHKCSSYQNKTTIYNLKSVSGSHEPPQHSQMNREVSLNSKPALLAEQHGCEGHDEQVTTPAELV